MRRFLLRKSEGDGNSMVDIKKFLSTPERPLTMQEFKEFWESCTEEEKEEFRQEVLPK